MWGKLWVSRDNIWVVVWQGKLTWLGLCNEKGEEFGKHRKGRKGGECMWFFCVCISVLLPLYLFLATLIPRVKITLTLYAACFFNGSFSIICLNPVFSYSLFECIKVYLNENLMQLGSWITKAFLKMKHTKNGTCRNQPCGQMEKCLLSADCSDPT